MSINHFSSDLQETMWWSTQHQKPPTVAAPWSYHHQATWPKPAYGQENRSLTSNPLGFNLNYGGGGDHDDEEIDEQATMDDEQEVPEVFIDKEHLFEKPLTPSDVGKLNRLVIPKQHAEKYFPLGADSGLLLTFEDECGKCWRFRYSYWSSSQSYVLTKGWSRYVKEKKLDAGDVILFERHRVNMDRLFIGWRRRGAAAVEGGGGTAAGQPKLGGGGRGGWTRGYYSEQYAYPTHQGHGPSAPDCIPAGPDAPNPPTTNSKRLRLFGVNLECQLDESEPSTPEESSISSQGLSLFSQSPYSSNLHQQQQQMDITFYQDVNHNHYHHNMRDRRR